MNFSLVKYNWSEGIFTFSPMDINFKVQFFLFLVKDDILKSSLL